MIAVRIDSVACDLRRGDALPVLGKMYDLDAAADPESARTGRSVDVRIPSTPLNDALAGYAFDPCCAERFNASYHEGVIEADGEVLLRGAARLIGAERSGGAAYYTIRITGGAGEWAERAARTPIGDALSDYACTLTGETIARSWSDDSPVKFLPVHRDEYRAAYSSTSIYPPQRMMSAADYMPFLSVAALTRAVFADAGYELRSDFMTGGEFRSLFMSGRRPSAPTSRMLASMGFRAGRSGKATAAADSLGRVYVTPLVLTHSLGNFVDTTDGGDLYNRNGVLTIDADGVRFTPVATVTAGFEFRLKYTTDYRILSRERLEGFDSVYVDAGCDIRFRIPNPFADRRAAPVAGNEYMCIVFGHEQGAAYRLVCGTAVAASWTGRTAKAVVPAAGGECVLQIRGADGSYSPYAGDWAMYDGYVAETGRTEVDVTLQSPSERITPSSPKRFTRMYLHGASEGQNVTLLEDCRLTPVFSAAPAEGSEIGPADVTDPAVSQADLLAALQQMYNLRFYTDHVRKRVYIEPYDDFFRDDVHDWSDRQELTCDMAIRDLAAEVHELRTLAYRADGGGAVARFEAESGERLGEWSFATPSRIALQGERRSVNGLFCATLGATGVYSSAPSAEVIWTGDRDADDDADTAVRIVRYEGLRTLPAGERWGYPSYGTSYPSAAFHRAGEFTLCFEDRDGAAGLHRRYDAQWRTEGFRQAVNVTMALDPDELTALLDYESDGPNIRSLFRLCVDGQTALYRLRAVEGYNIARHTAECVFFRVERDG